MGATDRQSEPAYAIGYGRPPKHSQFKPGQRANPKGRPRGSRNLRSDIERTLGKKIAVRRGDKTSKVTTLQAIAETQALKAAQGDRHAAALVVNLATKAGLFNAASDEAANTGTQPNFTTGSARPSDALVAGVDPTLLSKDEQIKLSQILERIDLGGVTALSSDEFAALKQIVDKGRGQPMAPTPHQSCGEAA